MKKSRTILGAAVAVAALVLSACGSDDPLAPSTQAAAPTTSASAADTAAASAGETAATGETSVAEDSTGASSPATSGAGSDVADPASLVIGSADFQESQFLAAVYAAALTDAGINATVKDPIGPREIYLPALEGGELDLLPEYSGSILRYYDKASTQVTSDDVYAALPAALPAAFEVLDQSPAESKDTVTVTAETAAKYNLKTIEDLVPVAGDLIYGGAPELQERPDGLPGLEKVYGLKFSEYKSLDSGGTLTINALKQGQIDAADIYTLTPAIYDNNFVVLEDPKFNFAAQNIVPMINKAKAGPTVVATLNALSAKLTNENITEALKKVYNGDDIATVAKDFVATLAL